MTTSSNRGTCRECGGDFQLTANGLIRSHGPRDNRCGGGSDLPVEVETTAGSMVNGMREDAAGSAAQDVRPTASEFREAQIVVKSTDAERVTSGVPGHVVSASEDIIRRATEHGVRPDSVTTVATNGTPMTVHGGPNPHRAPLPTGRLEQPQTDAFDTAAPVSAPKAQANTAPHRVRKGPEKSDFDQWGRYKLPDPATGKTKGRQRVTTFAKMISDQYGLSKWQQRMLLKGAVENPAVTGQAAGLDVKVNASTMDLVADALKDLAGDKVAADLGTEFHTFTEELDLGWMRVDEAPEHTRAGLSAYEASLRTAGLVPVPEFVERTTMVRSVDVAGTLDRILQLPNGEYVIGDVKTGQDLTYGWLDIGVQLACYAHGVNENGVWDWGTRTWLPAPKVREDFAVVMHAPAGGSICTLYRVDLTVGWANAVLAVQVREARKYRRHSQLLALDGPEFVPSPGAAEALEDAQPAVQSFGNAGTDAPPLQVLQVQQHTAVHVPTLAPPAAPPDPGCLGGYADRMAQVWTTAEASQVYGEAVLGQVHPVHLARLAEIGTQRLSMLDGARKAFASVTTEAQAAELYMRAVSEFGASSPIMGELVAAAKAALSLPF